MPKRSPELRTPIQRYWKIVAVALLACGISYETGILGKAQEVCGNAGDAIDLVQMGKDERAHLNQNPSLDTEVMDMEEKARQTYTREKIAKAALHNVITGVETPGTFDELQERIDNIGDQMIILSPEDLPEEFWEPITEEEKNLIQDNVKHIAFGDNITLGSKRYLSKTKGESLGGGVVLINTNSLTVNTEVGLNRLRGLVLHESNHESTKGTLTTVESEQAAYGQEHAFLARMAGKYTELGRDVRSTEKATEIASFIIEHYGQESPVRNIDPGRGLRALELIDAGIDPQKISKSSIDSKYARELNAALTALEEWGRYSTDENEASTLQLLIEEYMAEYHKTGDRQNLLIADNLFEIVVHINPQKYAYIIDELEGDEVSGTTGSSDSDIRLLPYLPTSHRIASSEQREPRQQQEQENDDTEEFSRAEINALTSLVNGSIQKRIMSLGERRRTSARLHVLLQDALKDHEYQRAKTALEFYLYEEENLHSDTEAHMLYNRILILLYKRGELPDWTLDSLEEEIRYHENIAVQLDAFLAKGINIEISPKNPDEWDSDFDYQLKHVPKHLDFSRKSLFMEETL